MFCEEIVMSSSYIQGDQAACPKPPVDIDLKLCFSVTVMLAAFFSL